MLRREKVAKPSTYRRKQDGGGSGVGGSDGTGVKHRPDDDIEYYTVTDVYAGTYVRSSIFFNYSIILKGKLKLHSFIGLLLYAPHLHWYNKFKNSCCL